MAKEPIGAYGLHNYIEENYKSRPDLYEDRQFYETIVVILESQGLIEQLKGGYSQKITGAGLEASVVGYHKWRNRNIQGILPFLRDNINLLTAVPAYISLPSLVFTYYDLKQKTIDLRITNQRIDSLKLITRGIDYRLESLNDSLSASNEPYDTLYLQYLRESHIIRNRDQRPKP